ncbi:hypothetical protein Hanom_Chr11g01041401 [Helianthus anomalus]
MALVEEVLIDRVNYLTMGLEDCFREINLLYQRLSILVLALMVPIFPQEDWNLANEIIQPTGWDVEILEPPPIDANFEVPINPTPAQSEAEEDPFIFLPRGIDEMLNDLSLGYFR